ncbi:hypothetical protein AVEN_147418-1 [Araneus ventricosus]|uniref:Uncharacterized protein n=1 Tax=Araneus ventricosus TaxID=182803 RepID=A0A4Y2DN92_ARAVE|nr:hypothetical protein AVEN_147418-1 [Araneus ventricosus]
MCIRTQASVLELLQRSSLRYIWRFRDRSGRCLYEYAEDPTYTLAFCTLKPPSCVKQLKINFVAHFSAIKNKSLIFHQGLKNVAGTSWGLSKNIRRQLYLTVVEKVILYASAAWAHNISVRQQKLLSSIQRKFLLNITGGYNTTPTAALYFIGLMPLHIKARMQSTLGKNCDYEGSHFDHESYEQLSPPSTIYPVLFSLEDRISHEGQGPSHRTPTIWLKD